MEHDRRNRVLANGFSTALEAGERRTAEKEGYVSKL